LCRGCLAAAAIWPQGLKSCPAVLHALFTPIEPKPASSSIAECTCQQKPLLLLLLFLRAADVLLLPILLGLPLLLLLLMYQLRWLLLGSMSLLLLQQHSCQCTECFCCTLQVGCLEACCSQLLERGCIAAALRVQRK
jgi:hypothetical protein